MPTTGSPSQWSSFEKQQTAQGEGALSVGPDVESGFLIELPYKVSIPYIIAETGSEGPIVSVHFLNKERLRFLYFQDEALKTAKRFRLSVVDIEDGHESGGGH